jgi:acyl dehydratase
MFPGKAFDQTAVGETFATSLTVTEAHLVLAAGLFGDFNPLHVDEAHAAGTRFRGRVLHGPFTSALMSAPIGAYFHTTAIAYLEHNCRFTAPVRPGDTLRTTWTIVARSPKPKQGGGLVELAARCENQEGEQVAEASGKILVASRRATGRPRTPKPAAPSRRTRQPA